MYHEDELALREVGRRFVDRCIGVGLIRVKGPARRVDDPVDRIGDREPGLGKVGGGVL